MAYGIVPVNEVVTVVVASFVVVPEPMISKCVNYEQTHGRLVPITPSSNFSHCLTIKVDTLKPASERVNEVVMCAHLQMRKVYQACQWTTVIVDEVRQQFRLFFDVRTRSLLHISHHQCNNTLVNTYVVAPS